MQHELTEALLGVFRKNRSAVDPTLVAWSLDDTATNMAKINALITAEKQVIDLIDNQRLKVGLKSKDLQLKAVEVISGISKKLKESPLSIESMDINDIKQTSATNFYEGLSHMKGVDMTSASLGFRVINTRGFNSTSPVRSLQIIDGVDNASPGLNFALGNFISILVNI